MSKFEKPIPICSFLPIFALSLTTVKGPAKFYKTEQNLSKSGTSASTHFLGKNIFRFFFEKFWSVCRWVGWCFIVSSFILAPTCVGHVRIDGGAASCCAQADQKVAGPLTLLGDNAEIWINSGRLDISDVESMSCCARPGWSQPSRSILIWYKITYKSALLFTVFSLVRGWTSTN